MIRIIIIAEIINIACTSKGMIQASSEEHKRNVYSAVNSSGSWGNNINASDVYEQSAPIVLHKRYKSLSNLSRENPTEDVKYVTKKWKKLRSISNKIIFSSAAWAM